MHFSLGNTYRGLIAGAITADGAALAGWVGGELEWRKALVAVIVTSYMLAAAIVDPGSKPPKDAVK